MKQDQDLKNHLLEALHRIDNALPKLKPGRVMTEKEQIAHLAREILFEQLQPVLEQENPS